MALSKNRAEWPREVTLKKAAEFPVIIAGKESGSVEAPAGAKVKLIEVQPDRNIRVEFNQSQSVIPESATDLTSRVLARRNQD